jgi:ankyrin repeat protein
VLRNRKDADRQLIDRLLYCVAERGNVVAARFLLQQRADVKGTPFARPLFGAIESGNLALVRLLIRHGAPLASDPVWGTPLAWAVFNGHAAIVRELLARGADPNARIRYDTTITPIVVALQRAPYCVGPLLRAGAAATTVVTEQRTGMWLWRWADGERDRPLRCDLLSIAAATGNATAVRLLQRYGAKPVVRRHGGNRGHALQVETLAEPTRRGMSLLRRGADLASIRQVVTMPKHLKGPHHRDNLMEIACQRQRSDVVRYFLKLGARPTALLGTLVERTEGSVQIARILLDAGYVREEGELFYALSSAIWDGNTRLVRLLLDHGAEVVAKPCPWLKAGVTEQMPTALMKAVAYDEPRCVELLLAHGADPNGGCFGFTPNKYEGQPAHVFFRGCCTFRGIVPRNPARQRGGPLHVAVATGNLRLFRLLLRWGADPDALPRLDAYVACLRSKPLQRRFEALLETARHASTGQQAPTSVPTKRALEACH